MKVRKEALVLGSGIIGLSTAVTLQERGFKVTIWAKEIPPAVTSNIAGGLITPYAVGDTDPKLIEKWTLFTLKRFREIDLKENNLLKECVLEQEFTFFHGTINPEVPEWHHHYPGFRSLEQNELRSPYRAGFYAPKVVVIDTPSYLTRLQMIFRKNGGYVRHKNVKDIRETFPHFSLICNCTGLGARSLFDDNEIFPTQGQVVVAKNFGFHGLYVGKKDGHTSYAFGRNSDILLGGTAIADAWDTTPDPTTTEKILADAQLFDDRLSPKNLLKSTIKPLVGLRPTRKTVRLERDDFEWKGQKKILIHNYGHGGCGWTLSWGCAKDVADLAKLSIIDLRKARLQKKAKM
eukprot:TRINITY_DN11736_c0_g1_i2.p2 TRINITY_DN11736_c0_g1~~TRINITY_DN11736_c0_g1_i2.p2  ORF type:complete len:348 (+),score=45.77 TRINITY_DN11736_c0_g1_i2:1110-2153(+)